MTGRAGRRSHLGGTPRPRYRFSEASAAAGRAGRRGSGPEGMRSEGWDRGSWAMARK